MSYSDWSNDFDVARINDVHQYDDNDDGTIDRTELEIVKVKSGNIEPNTPYLIKAKTAGEKTITLSDATLYKTEEKSYDVTSWNTKFTFTGTYSRIDGQTMVDNGYYAMGGGALVQAESAESNLGAFRWYLSVTDRNGTPKQVNGAKIAIKCLDFDDETTGITPLTNNKTDGDAKIYDLTGRYVGTDKSALKSGIYIQNGKKFNVK